MIKNFLFPIRITDNSASFGILILRIVFAGMLIIGHGWNKLMNFEQIAPEFMGGNIGLGLAVFAEVFCAAGIVVGFLHRLALIPLIINMSVAFFVAHGAAITGSNSGESPLLYLAVFLCIFITGAGKFSVDRLIANNLQHKF